MTETNKNIFQDSRNENLIQTSGEARTPLLSSACVENEQTNVHKYMNYDNDFFSFSRMESGSIPNRFYPTLDEAYRTTLTLWRSVQQTKNSKNNIFRISDSTHTILYEGKITPSGKIVFSIYNGKEGNTVSTIDSELNKLLTNKNITNMEVNNNLTASTVKSNEFKNNSMAATISSKANIFMENDILTPESIRFLCLSEDCAKSMAQSIQETAIANKDSDNRNFIEAVTKASDNMICITKVLASGKSIDNGHVSFHDDMLYCASHCKSKESLFDGSNTWRKVPGKIAYDKISDAIMEMYHEGQKMLLAPDMAGGEATVVSSPVQTAATASKKSLNDVAKGITATAMTYLRTSADIQYYLNIKNATLDSDLEFLSNGVFSGAVCADRITLNILSGLSKELILSDYPTDEVLRNAIQTSVAQLFVAASISGQTRERVSAIIELASIEEYYIETTLRASAITDTSAEENEEVKANGTNIDLYNSLVAERLCGIIDSEQYIEVRDKRVFMRTFLKTCASIAGLSEDTEISILAGLVSDPFYKGLAMEWLNGWAQPQQYSHAA